MSEDDKKLLLSLLWLHNNMVKSLDDGDSAELRRLLGIMEQSLVMALDEKETKRPTNKLMSIY